MIITIDGPAASGKGTLTRALSAHYHLPYLDTGLLYRLVGLRAHQAGIDPSDQRAATTLAQQIAATLHTDDLTEPDLRGALASQYASIYGASIPGVRAALIQFQKDFALRPGGAILDGRDTGTRIAPHADIKFYVTADVHVRAMRRLHDMQARGEASYLEHVEEDLKIRDTRDAVNLAPAPDAYFLDTTTASIADTVVHACRIIDTHIKQT